MGEIRLTCPECGAEYRIADDAIPPGGRRVECSSCGMVWHQAGPAAAAQAAPEAMPRLNRPLPDSVLSVLREEAALARHQRQPASGVPDDGQETALPPLQPGAALPAMPTEDWPATTVTTPLAGAVASGIAGGLAAGGALPPNPTPANPIAADPAPAGPAPSRHINSRPNRPTTSAPAHEVLEATVTRSTPHRAATAADDPAGLAVEPLDPTAHGYRRGFGWGLGIVAALLLLYVAAPRLAGYGQAGAALMEWRLAVDDGRAWLGEQASGLVGGGTH